MAITTKRLVNGALIALLCSMSVAQDTARSGSTPLDLIIQSMQKAQAATLRKAAYQVIREYRLFGATNSKANSEVVAEVNFRPPAFKDYRIQKSSGSSRGQQLVRQVLDHEVEATTNKASSAINTDNYNFDYIGEAVLDGEACYILGLKPKRKETDLISGEVWIDKHSFFGSKRVSGKLCILRGFLKNEEFGLCGRQALRFEQQVIHVSITAAASEQSFDVAIDGFNHTHRYLRPAVVQDALQMIQQHAG